MLLRQVTVALGDDMAYANTDSATVTHKTSWDLSVASQAQAQRQQETFFAGVVPWHNCNLNFQNTKTLTTTQESTGTLS